MVEGKISFDGKNIFHIFAAKSIFVCLKGE